MTQLDPAYAGTWRFTPGHTRIGQVEQNSFIVNGELTIKGANRQFAIPMEFTGVATDPFGNLHAGFEGSRRIDRSEYGVSWNKALDSGGVLVSERVLLEFEISAIKDVPKGNGTAWKQVRAPVVVPRDGSAGPRSRFSKRRRPRHGSPALRRPARNTPRRTIVEWGRLKFE